jgi:hypothetical protein
MRKQIVTGVMIVCLVLSVGLGRVSAKGNDAAGEVKLAIKYLLDLEDGASAEECKKGFYHLIGAVVTASPRTSYPADFRTRMVKADELFEKGGLLQPQAVKLINESYRSINSGKDYEFPKELKTIADARVHARKLMESSLKDLGAGRPDRAVKSMLECAIMVTTPIVKKDHKK